MRALEVHALAATLRDAAGEADIAVRLTGAARWAAPCSRPSRRSSTATGRRGSPWPVSSGGSGSTVAAVADSWVRLDGASWPRPAGCARHDRRRPGPVPLGMPPGDPAALEDFVEDVAGTAYRLAVSPPV